MLFWLPKNSPVLIAFELPALQPHPDLKLMIIMHTARILFKNMITRHISCRSFILQESGRVTLPSKHFMYVRFSCVGNAQRMTHEQDELAIVQDNVSNSLIGEMRMQFWRDAVKALADVRYFPDTQPQRS
jgi:hypothetical protein